MASFNKILLMGNLTRDPQLSYTPSQTAVVDFGLATNRKWTAQDGAQRDETCFVDCRAFGRMAENINKFFKKGKPIFVEGRLSFDQWTGQDGVKRSKHRVTVENFTFLPGTGAGGPDQADPGQGGYDEAGPPAQSRPGGPVPNDEIPF
ncbi:MAG: single-stranded DNA-binding protein [Phycisphaerales bacterium]